MTRLDRYIMAHIFGLSAIAALALTAIYTFVTFVSEIGDIGGGYGAPQLLMYVLWLAPTSLYVLLPIIAMLGTLMGLGVLAGQSELVAMRAAGVSLLQIGRSTLYAGLAFGALSLVLGDWLAPWGKANAEALRAQARDGIAAPTLARPVWLRQGSDVVYVRRLLAPDHVAGVDIYRIAPDLSISAVLHVSEAQYRDSQWRFQDVRITEFRDGGAQVRAEPSLDGGPEPSPELLNLLLLKANAISIRGLLRLIAYLDDNGLDDRSYALELWRKLMAPVTVVGMMLFAVPFVMGPLRSAGAGQRLLVGVLIGVGFYVVNEVTANTGQIFGWIPVLSAGLPTLLLLVAAFWRLSRMR